MKVVGLAGGSGSGKGAVCQIFASLGFLIVDTDALYHYMTEGKSKCLDELRLEFGDEILTAQGTLDRKKLADIVFSDDNKQRLARLNEISHFHILKQTREIIDKARLDEVVGVIIDAPLLFESGFDRECDVTVSVLAPKALRVERIMARDSISRERAEKRISAQLTDEQLKALSDYVIVNDADIEILRERVFDVANEINKI